MQQTEKRYLQEVADFIANDPLNTKRLTVAGFDNQTNGVICAGRKSGRVYIIHNQFDYLVAINHEAKAEAQSNA